MTLGAFHTQLFQKLHRLDRKTTSKLGHTSIVYEFLDEGTRRYMFGQEVDNTLAAKVLLQLLLEERVFPYLDMRGYRDEDKDGFWKLVTLERSIVSSFTLEETRRIFQIFCSGKGIRHFLRSELGKKGRELPPLKQSGNKQFYL